MLSDEEQRSVVAIVSIYGVVLFNLRHGKRRDWRHADCKKKKNKTC